MASYEIARVLKYNHEKECAIMPPDQLYVNLFRNADNCKELLTLRTVSKIKYRCLLISPRYVYISHICYAYGVCILRSEKRKIVEMGGTTLIKIIRKMERFNYLKEEFLCLEPV